MIEPVAADYGLSFTPLDPQQFDFVIPVNKWDRPAVALFRELLATREARGRLADAGFNLTERPEP